MTNADLRMRWHALSANYHMDVSELHRPIIALGQDHIGNRPHWLIITSTHQLLHFFYASAASDIAGNLLYSAFISYVTATGNTYVEFGTCKYIRIAAA